LAVFDQYIPDALKKLEHRFRFDPRYEPQPIDVPVGAQVSVKILERYFGVGPGDVNLKLASEWTRYIAEWSGLTAAEKEVGMGKFWSHATKKEVYPRLSALGRWYADMPTSSVAAERTFGVMRGMESKLRHSLSAESVEEELIAKVNRWIVLEQLDIAHKALKKL